MRREEDIAQQKNNGIVIIKSQDKRDVLMLSTCHDNFKSFNKSKINEDYNQVKGFVDLSDQMCSYTPFCKKI